MHNPRISNLVAIVFVGCGGAVLTKVEPAASGAGSCHDDRPVPITPSMPYIGHGGAPCSLAEGGTGIVLGAACIDANACRCKPEAGPASCMPGGDINLWPYVLNLNVHCVYELCGGANDGEQCALASGATGVCCASNCTQGMPAGVSEVASCPPARTSCASESDGTPCTTASASGICCDRTCISPTNDNHNCGGCGIMCCQGTACSPAGGEFGGMCL
jgi:hypothetical protein